MKRTIDIELMYQPIIDGPPPSQGNLYQRACGGDEVTVNNWKDIWPKNYKENKERFGRFADYTLAKLAGKHRYQPAIILGAGPSLKQSLEELKKNHARGDLRVPTISCLHNFGYFEDEGFHADYYVSLDAGKDAVVKDVSESRQKDPEHYWAATEGKVLLATTLSPPILFEKWRGEVYLFNSLIPQNEMMNELNSIERFAHFVSAGGNVLGACLYIAKFFFGCDPIIFVGADFCFDYGGSFHSYETGYDKAGVCVPWRDVYGMPRKTWPSYLNFKFFFDHVACNVPGNYINCSEGLLGAYPEGNIRQFQYKSLKDALVPYVMSEKVILQDVKDPKKQQDLYLKDVWENPEYESDLVFM